MTIDPIWGLAFLYLAVVLCVAAVIITALRKIQTGHSSSLRQVFRDTHFLELTTVLVIIVSGSFLAWSGKLSEGIVGLLSGVAGYVLGGLGDSKRQDDHTLVQQPKQQQSSTSVASQSGQAG